MWSTILFADDDGRRGAFVYIYNWYKANRAQTPASPALVIRANPPAYTNCSLSLWSRRPVHICTRVRVYNDFICAILFAEICYSLATFNYHIKFKFTTCGANSACVQWKLAPVIKFKSHARTGWCDMLEAAPHTHTKKSSDFRDRISAAAAAAAKLRPKIYIYWLLSEFELIWKMCGRVIYCASYASSSCCTAQLIRVPLYTLSANFFFFRVWCSRTGYT